MTIKQEMNLEDFEFWAGAKENAAKCTLEQLRDIQHALEECYVDGIDETSLNDLFWFEFDTLKKFTVGLEND